MSNEKFSVFKDIIKEMKFVYLHDKRPWMIGFSGGKDSTLLCYLLFEMLLGLDESQIHKKVYIISSDTRVENPIVKKYMHEISKKIGDAGKKLEIISEIIYPKVENTFWCKVIGLGYPTPEAPGFRWCTERLKIEPMNRYTLETIKNNGEVVLLLGVRKAESIYRANNIRNREIDGKLLIPHSAIENAYVYNPLTEISNEIVWEYLLKEDGITPWGTSAKYLFTLYQGENLGEEKSVIGEIDKDKIPITGNSRFGCWICTMVKEDKSLKNFIDNGEYWLEPLRDFRNWLLEIRNNPGKRESKRRNGAVYTKLNGEVGLGPFNIQTRQEILYKLLELQKNTDLVLIEEDELRTIDRMWEQEGDLSRRLLVDLYYAVMGERLPWDEYKTPVYDENIVDMIKDNCDKYDVEFELISKLIIEIENNKNQTKNIKLNKAFDRILNQGWLHHNTIKEGLEIHENQ